MIVLDTGVAYAAADRDDPDHDDAARVVADSVSRLVVPTPVVVETCWLLGTRLGPAAETGFLGAITGGELPRVDLDDADWTRVVELVGTYADMNLGVVDASVVAVAERLDVATIATLNHRDFRVVRPRPHRRLRADPLMPGVDLASIGGACRPVASPQAAACRYGRRSRRTCDE